LTNEIQEETGTGKTGLQRKAGPMGTNGDEVALLIK